jgi:hypothetical protein
LVSGVHPSGILEKRHETEIHVQLLVTAEKGHSWIVGHKIEFDFLKPVQHHHILENVRLLHDEKTCKRDAERDACAEEDVRAT